jgi:putative FmdB family regulatory protein
MPSYDYRCPTCEARFEVVRSMTEASGPVTCPAGHDGARRVFSAVASVGRAGAGPAPAMAGGGGGCCGGACGCG